MGVEAGTPCAADHTDARSLVGGVQGGNMVTIEHVESRADLAEAMAHVNAEAMRLSRRGSSATLTSRYADLHANLNMLLTSWYEATT